MSRHDSTKNASCQNVALYHQTGEAYFVSGKNSRHHRPIENTYENPSLLLADTDPESIQPVIQTQGK